jgi:hypothetical protein
MSDIKCGWRMANHTDNGDTVCVLYENIILNSKPACRHHVLNRGIERGNLRCCHRYPIDLTYIILYHGANGKGIAYKKYGINGLFKERCHCDLGE